MMHEKTGMVTSLHLCNCFKNILKLIVAFLDYKVVNVMGVDDALYPKYVRLWTQGT